MKYSKWIGLFAVALLFYASFQPWVLITSKNIIVTGVQTEGTYFGKPALMNLFSSAIAAALFMIPTVMAKRANLFFCGFNLAWSLRNFVIVSTCRAGECPEKMAGLYLLMAASILMILAAFFPDIKLKNDSGANGSQ